MLDQPKEASAGGGGGCLPCGFSCKVGGFGCSGQTIKPALLLHPQHRHLALVEGNIINSVANELIEDGRETVEWHSAQETTGKD